MILDDEILKDGDVVKLIAEKKIAATGMQFPKVMAQKAAEFADEYLKGKRDFQQKIPVKVASEWDTRQLGNLQIDYVLHSGRSSAGTANRILSRRASGMRSAPTRNTKSRTARNRRSNQQEGSTASRNPINRL